VPSAARVAEAAEQDEHEQHDQKNPKPGHIASSISLDEGLPGRGGINRWLERDDACHGLRFARAPWRQLRR